MFARPALRDATDAVFERDVSITTLAPIEAGNNHAYHVALADGTELVLKVGTRFPEAFPAEPNTMDRVRRETDLPVPRVYGTGTDPLEYPFAVYEYVPDCDAEWVGDPARPPGRQGAHGRRQDGAVRLRDGGHRPGVLRGHGLRRPRRPRRLV